MKQGFSWKVVLSQSRSASHRFMTVFEKACHRKLSWATITEIQQTSFFELTTVAVTLLRWDPNFNLIVSIKSNNILVVAFTSIQRETESAIGHCEVLGLWKLRKQGYKCQFLWSATRYMRLFAVAETMFQYKHSINQSQ